MLLARACARASMHYSRCRSLTHRNAWLASGTCSRNMACSAAGASPGSSRAASTVPESSKTIEPAAARNPKPQWRPVTTAFVRRSADGRVLVVQRSAKVSTYRGMWGGISGGVEGAERLVDRALLEVLEEAGLPQHQLQLTRCGRPLPVVDGHRHFLVHPFLFDLVPGASDAVKLNWENTAHQWVTAEELCGLPHVPLLPETLSRVLLPPCLQQHLDYLVQDREHGAAQLAAYVVEAFAAQLQPGGLLAISTPAADKEAQGMVAAACTAAADTSHQQDQEETTASDGPTAAVSRPASKQAEQPRTDPSTCATPASISSNSSNSRQSGEQVLEQLLDFGFLMATCRPSMAAIANAAAAVLLSLQRHLASSGSGGTQGAPATEELTLGNLDLGSLRAALQAAVQEEGARLHSMAAACSTHASRLLVELLSQQAAAGTHEQLNQAPGSRQAVLTTSISSAVYQTLVEVNQLLTTTSNSSRATSSSTAGSAEVATPAGDVSAGTEPLSVIVCESRPLCEGVTLACQLSAAGLNTTVITDAQAYSSLQGVGAVVLGCDAITHGGPVNKVGSALLALAAHTKGIPVVVVGDTLKVSPGPVMATCLPYALDSEVACADVQHTAASQQHGGNATSRQPHTAGQGAAKAQEEEEMDWRELSAAWKAQDAATVSHAAEEQRQRGHATAPDCARSGLLRVRNVYFEAVPWALVDRLVVETGVLDEASVAAQLQRQHAAYANAFQMTLLSS